MLLALLFLAFGLIFFPSFFLPACAIAAFLVVLALLAAASHDLTGWPK
jgi:hypothetical protein